MDGLDLIEVLVSESGLPKSSLRAELERLIDESKVTQESVTLEDIREILENYLKDVIVEAQQTSA